MTMRIALRALFLLLTVFSMMSPYAPAPAGAGGLKESLGEEIPISVLKGTEEEDPVIGWDGTNYMAVWQSNRKGPYDYNVYATRVNPAGKILDPQGLPISTAPSNQIFLDLAWGKGVYLMVWQDLRSHRRWEVYGARVRSDGTVLDPEGIPIAVGKHNARHPQVAWDGRNFLAVWMEEGEGTGWDVRGARISPEGTVLDPGRLLIAAAPGDQVQPVVAWGHDQYLVVWMDQRRGSRPNISGSRVSSAGEVLDPEGLILSQSTKAPSFPAVAWGGKQFVVVWADQAAPSAQTLSGVRVSAAGKVEDFKEFVVATGSNLQTFPSVQCREEECLVVWEEDHSQGRPMQGIESIVRDVRGAFLDLTGATVISRDVMISPQAIGNHFAKVATDGRDFLVVWKDYRTGTAASLGRLVIRAR